MSLLDAPVAEPAAVPVTAPTPMPADSDAQALRAQGVHLAGPGPVPRAAFLFPGHGAQYPDMLAGLAERHPAVGETLRRIDDVYQDLAGHTLTSRITSGGTVDPERELQDPVVMQPAIFAASMALVRLLEQHGIGAELHLGHSLGELAALTAAGALSLEDGVIAVHGRGAAVKSVEPAARGTMLSLRTDSPSAGRQLDRLLLLAAGQVTRSIVNSPEQVVVSGTVAALEEFAERCAEAGIAATRLTVSHGFHSPLLEPAVPLLEATLAGLKWRVPEVPVLSSVLGDFYHPADLPDLPAILARQLITPFSFLSLVETAYARGVEAFVEVGPKTILTGLAGRILAGRPVLTVPGNVPALGPAESVRRLFVFADVHGLRTAAPSGADRQAEAAASPVPAELVAVPQADTEELLRILARQTGYPQRMLDLGKRVGSELGFSARVLDDLAESVSAYLGVAVSALRSVTEQASTQNPTLSTLFDLFSQAAQAAFCSQDAVSESASASASALQAAADAEPAAVPPAADAVELARIEDLVSEVTQAKTGYPAELLEPDLDLEADLGIDSVKRAEIFTELRARLGITTDELPKGDQVDTLRRLAAHLAARLPSPAAPVVDVARVERLVSEVTQAKTGYPAELLEPDLDLEADLGIDSVKRAEIFTELRARLGITTGELPKGDQVDTLRKLAAHLAPLAPLAPSDAAATPAAPLSTPASAPAPGAARPPILDRAINREALRYIPVTVARPLPASGPNRYSIDALGMVVIADATSRVCDALVPLLRAEGAHVAVVGAEHAADPDRLTAALQTAREQLGPVHAVVNLYSLRTGGGAIFDAPGPQWAAEADRQFTVNMVTAKTYYAYLASAGDLAGYFAATAIGGVFGIEQDDEHTEHADRAAAGVADGPEPLGGLTAGFVKSLALELPQLRAKVVDFTELDAATVAETLLAEITAAAEPFIEVGYVRGERRIIQVLPHDPAGAWPSTGPGAGSHADSAAGAEPIPGLSSGGVVVVSGGARGISFECAKEMARVDGVTVALLGRTVPPAGDEEWLGFDDERFAAYRPEFLRETKLADPSLTPVAVNAAFTRLANARQLHRNLAEIQAINPRTEYHVCDVSDTAHVEQTLAKIRAAHGPVTGVVHGAGLESIGGVPAKRLDHARELVRIKAAGAWNLWQAAAGDQPGFFVLFGSILGRFGMDGQVDYTAGADLMPKLSALLARRHPRTRVLTICWTAWADTGMAASEAVLRIQRDQRRLRYLSVEEGVWSLMRELAEGAGDTEVLYFGDTGTNSLGAQDAALDAGRARLRERLDPDGRVLDAAGLPMVDTVVLAAGLAAGSVTARRRLDPAVDRYLADHLVRGGQTLPGVFHMEMHAETASLLRPGLMPIRVEQVEFVKFVKLTRRLATEIAVDAVPVDDGSGRRLVRSTLRSDLIGPGGAVIEAARLHSSGLYEFADSRPRPPKPDADAAALMAAGQQVDVEAFYKRIGQDIAFGPAFRRVRRIGRYGTHEVVAEIAVAGPRGLFARVASPLLPTSPILVDNAWHGPLAWAQQELGVACVPVSIDEVRWYGVPRPGQTVLAYSRITKVEESDGGRPRLHVDTQITDARGTVLVDLRDLVVLATESGDNAGDSAPVSERILI